MYMYMVWMCLCAESLTSCVIGTVSYLAIPDAVGDGGGEGKI